MKAPQPVRDLDAEQEIDLPLTLGVDNRARAAHRAATLSAAQRR